MSWLSRVAAAADRATVRLVPPARRDWAQVVLAEAYEVPSGWRRLAWRAGGVPLIAKGSPMVRRIGILMLFAAAAGAATWSAWPGQGGHAAVARADIIATVLLVAGLPLLARWLLGPPGNRAARWLRAGCYAAILVLMPAKAVVELFLGAVPKGGIDLHTFEVFHCPWPFTSVAAAVSNCHEVPGTSAGGPTWAGEVPILILTPCFLAAVLVLTARRVPVEPATLAIGAGVGLVLGAVMYAWNPLGASSLKYENRPWLHGAAVSVLAPLTWILLFAAPLVAGIIAGRRCHVPDDPGQASVARTWQGLAAGVVSGSVGVVFVTVFGTGTTALLVRSSWVRGLLYHGQHLTASAVYGRELFATQDAGGFLHRDVHAGAAAFIAGIGQQRQVLQVRTGFGQDELAGGGQVMGAAGQHVADPQRHPARRGQCLDVPGGAMRLAGVTAVDLAAFPAGLLLRAPVGCDQRAVQDQVGQSQLPGLLQGLAQRGRPRSEDVDGLVQVPVRGGLRDPEPLAQPADIWPVPEPGQHEDSLLPAGQRAGTARGADLAAAGGQQPGHEHGQLERDVKGDTIGQHAEPPGR